MKLPGRDGSLRLFSVRILVFGLSGVVGIVVARSLGPDEYGIYAAASAIVALILIAQLWGLDQVFLQQRIDAKQLQASISFIVLAGGVALTVVAICWPSLRFESRVCLILLGVAGLLDLQKSPYLLIPQRDLQFAVRARREFFTRIVRLSLVILASVVVHSAIAIAIVALVVSAVLFIPTQGRFSISRDLLSRTHLSILRSAAPYALSGALFTVAYQADMVILTSLSSTSEVGFYKAAYNLIDAAIVIPVVLNNDIMRPKLSRPDVAFSDLRKILIRSSLLTLGIGIFIGGALLTSREFLVAVLYGARYEETSELLIPLAISIPLLYISSVFSNAMIARRRVRSVLIVQGVLAVLNIVLNLLFVPSGGANGAAVATLITESVGVGLFVVVTITGRVSKRF